MSAQDRPGRRLRGQDGRLWRSAPNKNGVHRWVPAVSRRHRRTATPPPPPRTRVSRVARDGTRPRGLVEVSVAHPCLVQGNTTEPVRRALAAIISRNATGRVEEYHTSLTFQATPWWDVENRLDTLRTRYPDLRYVLLGTTPSPMRVHTNRSGRKTITRTAKRRMSVLALLPRHSISCKRSCAARTTKKDCVARAHAPHCQWDKTKERCVESRSLFVLYKPGKKYGYWREGWVEKHWVGHGGWEDPRYPREVQYSYMEDHAYPKSHPKHVGTRIYKHLRKVYTRLQRQGVVERFKVVWKLPRHSA